MASPELAGIIGGVAGGTVIAAYMIAAALVRFVVKKIKDKND